MSIPSSPSNESQRLAALRTYEILDTVTEQDYDELTELASVICDTPISLITFVDKDRQWFKSRKGLDVQQTNRSSSFCAHAILEPTDLFLVEDAREDERFKENPLVLGDPHIAFYAGIPLVDDLGYALGTLCVIDKKPKTLSSVQQKALKTLAKQVVTKLILRRKVKDLEKARLAIEHKEYQLRQMVMTAPMGMCIIKGEDLVVDLANNPMLEIWDRSAEKIIGHSLTDVFPELNNQPFPGLLRSVLRTGESLKMSDSVVDINLLDGSTKRLFVDFTYDALRDEDGSPIAIMATVIDTTDRKKEEQRRTDFLGMASHELKNPLTSINGYIQMIGLKSKNLEDPSINDIVSKARRQVDRMNGLISAFLDVARIGEGKIQLNLNHFDMATLLKAAEEESLATISSHEIIYHPVESIRVHADQDKIEQVLINFINNAVKYSPQESVINVTCIQKGDRAIVCVKDEGMGISETDRKNVFDRFFRVDNEHMKQINGFGIGLYICKEIIERHEGLIGVDSAEGRGSSFWFDLPIRPFE